VHRIGRTARAGASGSAYSLVCEDYGHNLIDIEKYLGENVKIQTEWFPESYLQIEDKAGNPYKDPEFKGSRMNDKEERRDGRRGDRSKRPDRDRNKAGASADGEKPRPERKPSGGPRIEARQDRGGAEGKERQDQPKQAPKGKRQDPRQQPAAAATAAAATAGTPSHPRGGNRHRKAHTNPGNQPVQTIQPRGKTIIKPVQPEPAVPNSFLGIFKKIFAIFFGKKK
ncbi:MAG: hypothetical protein M3Q07_29135, partial [Pseudobdellovibrionaceae bacterium]|nr:hypothetical protein [Pseudobdellovibrionaceae bacterium]